MPFSLFTLFFLPHYNFIHSVNPSNENFKKYDPFCECQLQVYVVGIIIFTPPKEDPLFFSWDIRTVTSSLQNAYTLTSNNFFFGGWVREWEKWEEKLWNDEEATIYFFFLLRESKMERNKKEDHFWLHSARKQQRWYSCQVFNVSREKNKVNFSLFVTRKVNLRKKILPEKKILSFNERSI